MINFKQPKILLLDIETAPMISYIWSLYQDSINTDFVINDWYVLSWAAKYLNNNKVYCKALCDYPLYKKEQENDKELLKDMWKLLDDADIVIAHNGLKFDLRRLNARFVFHGMPPPSPYKVIDTLREAKKHFKFTSNRLNDLGKMFNVGQKVKTGGFELWRDVLANKSSAWRKMKCYNKGDVVLLEKVYHKILPYIVNHPNFNVYSEAKDTVCPKCGSKNWIYRGIYYCNVTAYKRITCKDCGGWSRTRIQALPKEKRENIILNAK
jgi:DNA polymerase elongation subunit (family B)